VNWLLKSENESFVRASLAKLRRGIGKPPGSLSNIWEFTLQSLPEEFMSTRDEPTYAQWASYTAITLFALHQQGKDPNSAPMSVSNWPLGSAVSKLAYARGEGSEDAIKKRFDAVVTADSVEELAHHLRGIIQLLKSEGIPLDYPDLAEDIYKFQFPDMRDGIRLKWGQDYFRIRKGDKNDEQ
jgi:CRISPR system Cascade subunit CasB